MSALEKGCFSACSGTFDLFYQAYKAQASALGTVVLVHGFGEHGGRYMHVADALVRAGFNVLLFDLPGYGRSTGARGHIRVFEQYVSCVNTAVGKACDLFKTKGVLLFGHSMGGLIAMHYAALHRSNLLGLILSSPLCKQTVQIPMWHRALIHVFSFAWPTLLFPVAISPGQLTHDASIIKAYENDPLPLRHASASCLLQLREAMRAGAQLTKQIRVPVLLQLAGDDKVIDTDTASRLFAKHSAAGSKTLMYEGFYHEIYNEVDRHKPMEDLIRWMKNRA